MRPKVCLQKNRIYINHLFDMLSAISSGKVSEFILSVEWYPWYLYARVISTQLGYTATVTLPPFLLL